MTFMHYDKTFIKLNHKQVRALIKQIDSLILDYVSIEKIKHLLDALLEGYVTNSFLLRPGVSLYRGIKWHDKPLLFSNISYPPKDFAKAGRANRDGNPIFYCTGDKVSVFKELGIQPGDRLVLSRWVCTKDIMLNQVGFTDEAFKMLNSDRSHPEALLTTNHAVRLAPTNILKHNALARWFCQRISDDTSEIYKLTMAITEIQLEGSLFSGLIYPTISRSANSENFALKPNTIDNKELQFVQVDYLIVENVVIEAAGDEIFHCQVLDTANKITNEGTIQWLGVPEN